MDFGRGKLMSFVRMVLAIAFMCSSFSHSLPVAQAADIGKDTALTSLEHDHSTVGERVSSILEWPSSEAVNEECQTDGRSHNGHSKSTSDCCAAVCFDLTILSSVGCKEARTPLLLIAELHQSLLAVEPYRFLRPPRA